jgi:hypothetical protein
MTDADKPEFLQAIGRLCVALREKEPDVVQMRVYFDALRLLEIELVMAAAERLMLEKWFPKVSEWLETAIRIENERIEQQRAILRKLPSPLCLACDDTGWADTGDNRVKRCDCQRVRRLEILGRRPMPELPASTEQTEPTVAIDAEALASTLASTKGMR